MDLAARLVVNRDFVADMGSGSAPQDRDRESITVLTGFLGAGKTDVAEAEKIMDVLDKFAPVWSVTIPPLHA